MFFFFLSKLGSDDTKKRHNPNDFSQDLYQFK